VAFSIVPVVRQKSYGNQQKTCFGALFYKFSAVSFVGLKFNVYYAKSHIVQAMNLKQDDSRLPKAS
jgi:hypothetical protein